METLKYLFFVFMVASLCMCSKSDKKDNQKSAFILTSKQAGPFKIGDALPDSSDQFKLRTEQRPGPEGSPRKETVYYVSQNGEELMRITPQYDVDTQAYTDNIDEIIVSSPRFRTKKNIGSGSTIEEFTTAYPEAKVWYTYVSDRFVLETKQYENMQFLLYPEDFTGNVNPKSEITPLTFNDFNESATVRAVRIY